MSYVNRPLCFPMPMKLKHFTQLAKNTQFSFFFFPLFLCCCCTTRPSLTSLWNLSKREGHPGTLQVKTPLLGVVSVRHRHKSDSSELSLNLTPVWTQVANSQPWIRTETSSFFFQRGTACPRCLTTSQRWVKVCEFFSAVLEKKPRLKKQAGEG